MRVVTILIAFVLAATCVLAQPGMMGGPGGMIGSGMNLGGLGGLNQQQVSFVPMRQQPGVQQQPNAFAQQPLAAGAFNQYPNVIQQQQPIYQQPIMQQQQQPLMNQIASQWTGLAQQQPMMFGNAGAVGGVGMQGFNYGLGTANTIPAVLPQNYGNPAAAFGQLQQPVLSQAQLQNIVPTAQLQAALDQRVGAFPQVQQPMGFGGIQQQPFIGA